MIDTHAHLLMFEDDKNEIINNMVSDGLKNIVTMATTVEDSEESVKLASKNERIYATVGIYPEYSKTTTKEDLVKIKELAKNEKVVAIGEIGLDYHTEDYDKVSQKEILIEQLKIADEMCLPFCIHCRRAVEDLYEILSQNKYLINHSGLMHCYSEGKEWFQKFLDLGLYISFSGNITYRKKDRSFLKDIPLDRILVETDSPFLSPAPVRGERNQPKNVKYTLQLLASEIKIPFKELEKITENNARNLYYKIK